MKSSDDNVPLADISIQVEKSSRGAITDKNGQFTILAGTGETLSFSGIGFNVYSVTLQAQSHLDVVLVPASNQMDSVVVTALGIRREEKALGYSITSVKGSELTDAISNNWTDALTGKVAGLNLVKSGAGPAGSNQIILRGETSLTGDNSALIVVDGVIISGGSGTMTGQGSSNYQSGDAPVDFGTSLADINPNDIESVSVLKGPGAAALYGARGANGAIIITTKKGKGGQKGIG
ncbi:MAG TPA: TonB-dependent receptor plug domain-containing protein, partial [Niabella sp.]|nr:TonB-dependent receptor plug domain-containing protein [Niabella sp.]